MSSFIKPENDLICDECGLAPCDGVTYKVALETAGSEAHKRNQGHHRVTRHHPYKFYIAPKYGSLGRWNRVCIPQCVETIIHKMYPDPKGEYVGFCNGPTPSEMNAAYHDKAERDERGDILTSSSSDNDNE